MASSVPTVRDRRRSHTRVHVQVDVTIASDSQLYTGLSENLSEGGVFVATHVIREVGDTIDITLRLPDSKPIRTVGEVRWVREVSDRIDTPSGMGLRFRSLGYEDAAAIQSFIRKRAPLLFEE
jgi:uncharacterized protein (TIGR02266 family)